MLKAIDAGSPVGGSPYSPAVRAGDFVFVSGQLGLDPLNGKPLLEFADQMEAALQQVRLLIEAAGGTLDNVVKVTVFLADLQQFPVMNQIYVRYFTGDVRPARSTVQVARLPLDAAVEIEVIAFVPQDKGPVE